MKRNKRLDPIIDQAVKSSFKDGRLLDSQAEKIMKTFKGLSKVEAIYLTSGYLKRLKRELAKHTLVIESATPLTASEMDQIENKLNDKFSFTSSSQTINPDLLGGIKAQVGDTVYDFSIKGKLNQVKEAIHG